MTLDGEYANLIIESARAFTALETELPERLAPGLRSRGVIFLRETKSRTF